MSAAAPSPTQDRTPRLPATRAQAEIDLLKPWLRRKLESQADRRMYERQWMINQHFAAGIQHLKWNGHDRRVLSFSKDSRGRLLDTVDVLSQYCGTAVGKLGAGDLRPELLCSWANDDAAEDGNDLLNNALAYCWDEEVKADRKLKALLRCLVELGTGAIRTRYDRGVGKMVNDSWPHRAGRPLSDASEVTQVMGAYHAGPIPGVEMKPLREGKICWEKLSAWNLLPPPGIEDPTEFPWEIIVRPVALSTLQSMYGSKAADLHEDSLDEMGLLIYQNTDDYMRTGRTGDSLTPATVMNLKKHALVYTGYQQPDNDNPNGLQVVWAQNTVLSVDDQLPLSADPYGPRSGLTYFRWQPLEGRFWGRAFIEPGIGPQKIRNKRRSQQNEIIDRGLPKVYVEEGAIQADRIRGVPVELIEMKVGSSAPHNDSGVAPGPWMQADIQQLDNDLEQALGLKQSSLGQAPAGVSAYSAMALLSENDSVKLDPIASELQLGIADVVRDTVELMKQWPSSKLLYVAGPEDELKVQEWDAQKAIPTAYKARPAKGSALPRTQAAQVQKIADIANYSATIGEAQQDPDSWLDWYVRSLDAGELQELPQRSDHGQQVHRAAIENALMSYGAPAPPVAPYDDPQTHIQEHTDRMMAVQSEIAFAQQSDPGRVQQLQAELEQLNLHRQAHLLQMQQNAAVNTAGAPAGLGGPPQPGAPPPQTVPSAAAPFPPEVRFMNEIQTPRLPYEQAKSGGFR